MDSSIISASSAVLGSLVGGTASIAAAWFSQKHQSRHTEISADIRKREILYAEFINECSKLAVDALDGTLEQPETLVQAYALVNRIALIASDEVVRSAKNTIHQIVEQYSLPTMSLDEIRAMSLANRNDPLACFSEACREELRKLHRFV